MVLADISQGVAMPKTDHLKRHQFKKGVAQNPGGRPALSPDVKETLRARTPEAIEELWKICTKALDPKVRLAALTVWLSKTVPNLSAVEMSGPEGGPVPVAVSADETLQRLARIVAEAKAKALGEKQD